MNCSSRSTSSRYSHVSSSAVPPARAIASRSGRRPEVLDERDRRGGAERDGVGQRPGRALRRLAGTRYVGVRSAEDAGRQAAHDRAVPRPGRGSVSRVPSSARSTSRTSRSRGGPGLAQAVELRHHLAGEREPVEADDQDLDRPGHRLVRVSRSSYSSAVSTPESRSCRSAASVSACGSRGDSARGAGAGGPAPEHLLGRRARRRARAEGCEAAYAWAGVNRPP